MPIHAAMSSRFPLLESVPSMQALVEDPAYAQVRAQFEAHPDYQVPEVIVRSDDAPGPHGAVPVRVYDHGPPRDGSRPCLVWMHGGGFVAGNLDMPEADWTARELAWRAGAVVVSVDYRLCNDGVHFPVPHDDVVAAVRWARDSAQPGHRRGPGLRRRRERGSEPGGRRRAEAPRRRRAPAGAPDLRLRRGTPRHPADVRRPRRADARGARAAQVPAGGDELPQREFSRRSH